MPSLRHLFGGAMTAELPALLVDASTVRQVPDNQEVFFSPTSNISYIVEILQRVEPNDPVDAAKFHFDSLAHDNEALSSSVSGVTVPDNFTSEAAGTPSPILVDGSQRVAKFNHKTLDDVHILLAIYRLASRGVDIVLSANLPVAKETDGCLGEADLNIAKDTFKAGARSLKIVDFGLFP